MRIGVLSDSHAYALEDLPEGAVNELDSMDVIVHVGDYTGNGLLEELQKRENFKGVYGNMDPPVVREKLLRSDLLEVMGFKIGVTHPAEGGAPFWLEKRVRAAFEQVDVIVYGHSHWPKSKIIQVILYFNPGSVTGMFPARHKTFGVLTVGKDVNGKIVKL